MDSFRRSATPRHCMLTFRARKSTANAKWQLNQTFQHNSRPHKPCRSLNLQGDVKHLKPVVFEKKRIRVLQRDPDQATDRA